MDPDMSHAFASALVNKEEARGEGLLGKSRKKEKRMKEFDKKPKIHPGRLIKATPMEEFQSKEFCQDSIMQLKENTKARMRLKEKKREKRAWELRTNDGSNFFQKPTRHLTPEEEEQIAYEHEQELQREAMLHRSAERRKRLEMYSSAQDDDAEAAQEAEEEMKE